MKTRGRKAVGLEEMAADAANYSEEWKERGESLLKRDSLLAGFAEAVGQFQRMFAARAAEIIKKEGEAYCAAHCAGDGSHERKCPVGGERVL